MNTNQINKLDAIIKNLNTIKNNNNNDFIIVFNYEEYKTELKEYIKEVDTVEKIAYKEQFKIYKNDYLIYINYLRCSDHTRQFKS